MNAYIRGNEMRQTLHVCNRPDAKGRRRELVGSRTLDKADENAG
jgi:hypothetical protein